jgi:ferrous iron transport protein A
MLTNRKPHVPQIPNTLAQTKIGQRVCVTRIQGSRSLAHRLAEMGLTPGTVLQVLHDNGGPMVVKVRGSQLAVGRSLANALGVALHEPPQVNPA